MIEFKALVEPPKWMVQKKKHRIIFDLNEGNENLIVTTAQWAFKRQLVKITAVGDKGLNFTIVALCDKYRFNEDRTISIIFDCFDADSIAVEVAKSALRGEWITVRVEETEKPNGIVDTRTVRKSEWQNT